LALSWEGKASFVLTESLVLKKVTFLDGASGGMLEDAGGDEDKFDADVVLSTGTLAPLLADLMDALGGEMRFITTPGDGSGTSPSVAATPSHAAASEALSDSPFV